MSILGEPIRDFSGKIIAYEKREGSDIIVFDFYGKNLGRYDSHCNVTRDFSGRIIAQGDAHGMLLAYANK